MLVMLADDDSSIRAVVEHVVNEAGYDFVAATDGLEALTLYEREKPDVLVLDVMMPKLNGFEIASLLRQRGETVPILMLTAKSDIADKADGFQAGADDYLVKPFLPRELSLRIDALLRRATVLRVDRDSASSALAFDGLSIDVKRRRVEARGVAVSLTPKEFHLLHMLASSPGEVFSREQLIRDIWGPEYVGEVGSITVLIHRLREKIEEDPRNPRYIQTVWHVGYRFGD